MADEKTGKCLTTLTVEVDCTGLDAAIEKANRLVELLREASTIIDSLCGSQIRILTGQ